jgi:hypothetical protein
VSQVNLGVKGEFKKVSRRNPELKKDVNNGG